MNLKELRLIETKYCSGCKETKSFNLFCNDNGKRDGLTSRCKQCFKNYRLKNKDIIKEKHKKYSKQYYISNKDKANQYSKQYYYENRSSRLKMSKNYGQTPKGKLSHYKSSAKARNISWYLTNDEFMILWQKPCSYCGGAIATIGIDRINSNIGYQIDNCVSCCTRCNLSKLDSDENEWLDHMVQILKYKGII